MAANVEAAEDTAPAATSGSDGAQANGLATMERTFSEAARKFEKTVQDSLETLRAQSRAYADTAGQQIDEAQRYVVERVKVSRAGGSSELKSILLRVFEPRSVQNDIRTESAASRDFH